MGDGEEILTLLEVYFTHTCREEKDEVNSMALKAQFQQKIVYVRVISDKNKVENQNSTGSENVKLL